MSRNAQTAACMLADWGHMLMLVACLQEYKIHNCDLLFKEDSTVDDLIDVIEVSKQRAPWNGSRLV